MSLLGGVLLFGASQGLLMCMVILLIKTGERSANQLLALFLGISAAELALLALSYSGQSFQSGWYTLYAVAILKGPALYLYVRALTEPGFTFGPGQFKHLLLLLPNLALILVFTLSNGASQTVTGDQLLTPASVYWYSMFLNAVGLIYAVAALRVLNQYRSRVEDLFSSTEEISLGWLKWLLVYYISLRVGNIALDVMSALGLVTTIYKSYAVALLNIGVIYFVSFGGLRQPVIFSGQFRQAPVSRESVQAAKEEATVTGKYGKSGLTESGIERIWSRLTAAMTGQQLFMSPELTLPGLAAELQVSANDLSRVINGKANKSFYDFVNGYRVDAACEKLLAQDNKGRRMVDLAMAVGFKSQSTFYTHFKKHRGMTPTRYRDEMRGESR